MGGWLLEGPTIVGTRSDWKDELGRWLKPFLDRLGHKARRQMCPLYVAGLIGPGDGKSVQPMAERLGPGEYDRLHHFVSAGVWEAAPLERELLIQADRLVGGSDTVLVIDDTAVPKKGQPLGRRGCAIRFSPGQDRQLPDAGVADASAWLKEMARAMAT
jgi:SRSO17 transposase